jgi:PAS domain S-box-containing protein
MTSEEDAQLTPGEGAAILATLARGANGRPARPTPLPQRLAIAEARYRALVEQIPAVTFMASLEGGLSDVYVSPQIEGLLGFSQEEWMSDPVLWFRQLHPDDRDLWNREFARGCATGGPFRAACRFLTKDGRVVWVHGEARLIADESGQPVLLQGVAFDITEGKRAEEIVKSSLREKELLLKEIHHRVKNNLQITSSLLRLQAAKISDLAVRQLLRESQDRIRSMALVHDMLYRSEDLARVDFRDYVRTLVLQLFRSYNASRRVRYDVELEEIVFGVDLAVPCGLIINELVANSLKHAFPGDRQGKVRVRMTAGPDHYTLSVSDDGVGFPPATDFRQTETLGLQLVRMLTDQIGGHLRLDTGDGTEFVVEFPRAQEPG